MKLYAGIRYGENGVLYSRRCIKRGQKKEGFKRNREQNFREIKAYTFALRIKKIRKSK